MMLPSSSIDDEHYQVSARLEVVAILRALMDNASLVTLYFGSDQDFIVTAILAVWPEQNMLILDLSADAAANRRALAAGALHACSELHHIRIEFDAGRASEATYEGLRALCVPIPTTLQRLQRREAYRLKIPLSRPIFCIVATGEGAERREAAIRLFDISISGFSMIDAPATIPLEFGMTLKGCRIDLPEVGEVTADFEIVHCIETRLANRSTSRRYGCRFLDLSSRSLTLVQRYINRVERHQIAHGRQ